MARLTAFANFAFDYRETDFHQLFTPDVTRTLMAGVDETYAGVTYHDVLLFEYPMPGGAGALRWGGPSILMTGDVITGGTITGMSEEFQATGGDAQPAWALDRFSVAATAMADAAATVGNADDLALIASLLAGADTARLSGAADVVRGYAGNDSILGNGGNDVLAGDAGNDSIAGGSGSDSLTGGRGKDTLTGNAGRDIFDFDAAADTGLTATTRDVVTDFASGVDRIDLSGIDANSALGGNQAFRGNLIAPGATFTLAGQLRLANGVLYGNTDSDAAAEFSIQLTGVTSLVATDFVL